MTQGLPGDLKKVVSEMKTIEDHINKMDAEIQKFERFVNEVSGQLAKETEVNVVHDHIFFQIMPKNCHSNIIYY